MKVFDPTLEVRMQLQFHLLVTLTSSSYSTPSKMGLSSSNFQIFSSTCSPICLHLSVAPVGPEPETFALACLLRFWINQAQISAAGGLPHLCHQTYHLNPYKLALEDPAECGEVYTSLAGKHQPAWKCRTILKCLPAACSLTDLRFK